MQDEILSGQSATENAQVNESSLQPQALQNSEVVARSEKPAMERWDELDEEIAKLREQEDQRARNLLQGVDVWINGQASNWGLEERTYTQTDVYLGKDDQGNSKQYLVEFHGKLGRWVTLGVDEISPENQDPNKVKTIDRGHNYGGYIVDWHRIEGTTIYNYNAKALDSIDNMRDYDFLVAKTLPEDHQSEYAPNAYGFRHYRTSGDSPSTKFIRNRPKEKEKRVDPIIEGEKTLKALQSAQFLGIFDKKTGEVVLPKSPLTG